MPTRNWADEEGRITVIRLTHVTIFDIFFAVKGGGITLVHLEVGLTGRPTVMSVAVKKIH